MRLVGEFGLSDCWRDGLGILCYNEYMNHGNVLAVILVINDLDAILPDQVCEGWQISGIALDGGTG